MGHHDDTPPPDAAQRPHSALRSRSFVLLLVATFGAISNYAGLLSVVPLWAASGGSGGTGVGATTGVMMGATVASQFAMGWLLRRLSLRAVLLLGATLMGLATPAYILSDALLAILAVSAVRGIGFGMVVVAGSALTAELIPSAQLGKGIGIYGLSTGLPNIALLPGAVWVAQEIAYPPVFWFCTGLALIAIPVSFGIRTPSDSAPRTETRTGSPDRLTSRVRPLLASTAIMVGASIGMGGTSTFLPLALTDPTVASVSLLALSLGINIGRLGGGAVSDAIGAGQLLLPAVVFAAAGMAGISAVSATDGGFIAPLAAFAYGLGFGSIQTDTLVIMFRRAGSRDRGLASTVWNMAFDGGTGIGALALGVVVAGFDESAAFALSATLIAVTLPFALRDGRRG